MLPFGVTSVTSDGKAVDWCRKPSDDDKQFLLKWFASDTATEAKFENVDGWIPYTPYLLGVPASLINKKMVFLKMALILSTGICTSMVAAGCRLAFICVDSNLTTVLQKPLN